MKEEPEHITIAGRKIECFMKEMDIFELQFYPENPRINHILSSMPPPATQDMIEQKLWEQDSVKELYQDIKKNRGLIEEIFVKGRQVIEGNSRLCAYRHLHRKAATDEDKDLWSHIRAKILPMDVTEEEIFILLGTFHIKLKAQWKPFEKAGYVHRMVEKLDRRVDELAAMLNTDKTDIRSDINSYETMQRYDIREIDRFSYFKEFYKNSGLQKRMKEDLAFLSTFVEWVVDERIPRAEDVRQLNKILDDKKVGPNFARGILDFEEAFDEFKKRHPEHVSKRGRMNIYKHMKQMTGKLRKIPVQKVNDEIDKDARKKSIVEYFVIEVGRFADNIGAIKKYKGRRSR